MAHRSEEETSMEGILFLKKLHPKDRAVEKVPLASPDMLKKSASQVLMAFKSSFICSDCRSSDRLRLFSKLCSTFSGANNPVQSKFYN